MHPGCGTYTRWPVLAVKLRNEHGTLWFARGKGLLNLGKYEIRIPANDEYLGRTDDPSYAKAWQAAALFHGINVEVLES